MKSYQNSSFSSVPNNTVFNQIRNANTTFEEVSSYYQALQGFLNKCHYDDPDYNIALKQSLAIELILDNWKTPSDTKSVEFEPVEYQPSLESPTGLKRDRLEQAYYKQKTIAELESEILAAATSKNFKLALTKVAAINGLPFDVVEHIADSLLKDQGLDSQHDLSGMAYERCVKEIRQILLEEDPGRQNWKLEDIARKYHRRSVEKMMESFYKSLLVQHLEDPISLKDYIEKHPSPTKWLLRGWIPASSLVLLHGHSGVGKTLLIHHLMKHIIQGIDWHEYKVTSGLNGILYIQTDTPLKNAINMLKQTNIPEDVPIHVEGKWRIEFMSYLYKWAKQIRPALIVIDSLSSVNRFSTVSENDTSYARPILQMQDITDELGCSFVIMHHSNGAGEVRGTKAVKAAVDMVLRLEDANKNNQSDPAKLLVVEKSRLRNTQSYKIKFDDDNFSWDLLDPEDEDGKPTQNSSARWLIVNHLNKYPGKKYCTEDLAHEIRIPEATVRRELPGLFREGLIDRELNPEYNNRIKGMPKHYYLINIT